MPGATTGHGVSTREDPPGALPRGRRSERAGSVGRLDALPVDNGGDACWSYQIKSPDGMGNGQSSRDTAQRRSSAARDGWERKPGNLTWRESSCERRGPYLYKYSHKKGCTAPMVLDGRDASHTILSGRSLLDQGTSTGRPAADSGRYLAGRVTG